MITAMRFALARLFPVLLLPMLLQPAAISAEPFKLGVQEKGYVQDNSPMQGYADYPAPAMIPQQGSVGAAAPLRGGAVQQAPRPPIQAGVQKQVQLPPQFLGAWNVRGQRTKVEAEPSFQSDAERAFATQTSNVWNIGGQPGQYMLSSNTGIQTPLVVDQVQGNTAFIRYQHPIGKTMAQEAVVMTLTPTGAQFNGLERISIVKDNGPPRAKVTYQLTGFRQR